MDRIISQDNCKINGMNGHSVTSYTLFSFAKGNIKNEHLQFICTFSDYI